MADGEFLSADEVQRLTGQRSRAKQAAWLKAEGIPGKQDGSRMIVSRVHVRAWLEGRPVVSSTGPNWSAMPRHA